MGNLVNNDIEELPLINVLGMFIAVVLGAAGMWVAAQSAKVAT